MFFRPVPLPCVRSYVMAALNPDRVILDAAETAYLRGNAEEFKRVNVLVGDIPLYPGYLTRGHPQTLLHVLQARLYEHRYGSRRLAPEELRFAVRVS